MMVSLAVAVDQMSFSGIKLLFSRIQLGSQTAQVFLDVSKSRTLRCYYTIYGVVTNGVGE